MTNILLAEDDLGMNLMVSKVLKSNNYNVISAYNGKEAIEILEKSKIDIVITDIMMPFVDGIELLNYIKSSQGTNSIPVIGFSAGNKEKIFARLGDYKFDFFYEKPVNLKVLVEKINELLL
ncbi:response regulator [Lunatimonas salinarum]|uniref:response regulator n=1 Tax=Lunatimonas salinarum TaxID=1774590 RepID=UPI001ADF1CC7|nr:response regulator [Lunatimonas salinarum]